MRRRSKSKAGAESRLDRIRRQLDLAQISIDRGDPGSARAALTKAEVALEARGLARSEEPALLRGRAALLRATVARRRGTLADAEHYLAIASARLEQAGGAAAGTAAGELDAAIVHLQADLAISRGAYERAGRILTTRLEGPIPLPRSWAITFRRSLGAILTRRGRPTAGAEAYRLALDALPASDGPNAEAALRANLAMTLHMRGDDAEAQAEATRALALRRRRGIPLRDLANTTALVALVATPASAAQWDEALALAEGSGDLTLATEVRLLAARHFVGHGGLERARTLLAQATPALATLARQEPILQGLGCEVAGLIAAAAQRPEAARGDWFDARRHYADLDAGYHVARIDAELAALEAANTDGGGEVEWILATRAANRNGFRLPARFDPLARRFRDANVECERYARRHGLDAPRLGPEVVLDRKRGCVRVFGQTQTLGPASVTFRVLSSIIRAGPRGITPQALCRSVWPGNGPSAATLLNRLRFQIHRLRGTLGSSAEFILCIENAGVATRYLWNPAIRVCFESADTIPSTALRTPSRKPGARKP